MAALCLSLFLPAGQGPASEADQLVVTLTAKDAWARRYAATALRDHDGQEVVDALTASLQDSDVLVRQRSAESLGRVFFGSGEQYKLDTAITRLRYSLRDDDVHVRRHAAQALGILGRQARAAVPDLIRLSTDENEALRAQAVLSLGEVAFDQKAAVDVIAARAAEVNESSRLVREAAVASLPADRFEFADVVVPSLARALCVDSDVAIRRAAAERMFSAWFDDTDAMKEALPHVARAVEDDDRVVRKYGVMILRHYADSDVNWPSEGILPAIQTALSDQDTRVRTEAAEVAALLGNEAAGLVPRLADLLVRDGVDAFAAAKALGSFGPGAAMAVPEMTEALVHSDQHVRAAAARSLGQIGPQAKDAIPALLQCFSRDPVVNEELQRNAMYALGEIGPASAAELPTMMIAAQRPKIDLREAARLATIRISGLSLSSGDTSVISSLRGARTELSEMGFSDGELAPVDEAITELRGKRHRLWAYAAAGLFGVGAIVAMSGRIQRFLRMVILRQKWALVPGTCDHLIDVSPTAENIFIRVRSNTAALSTVDRRTISPAATWPPAAETVEWLQSHFRITETVQITVDEQLFHHPWMTKFGGSWSEGRNAVIAGQTCAVTAVRPRVPRPTERLLIDAVGCATAAGHDPLQFVESELAVVEQVFRKRGAVVRTVNEAKTGPQRLREALLGSHIVHVSAHANDRRVLFGDAAFDITHISTEDLSRARCRLLVLSACEAGSIDEPEASFVFALLREGVNVLGAVARVNDLICTRFFEYFYESLLPRQHEGVSLAAAVRRAAELCRRDFGVDLVEETLERFVFYGDPSLRLILKRFPVDGESNGKHQNSVDSDETAN